MRISDWSSDVCSSDLQPIWQIRARGVIMSSRAGKRPALPTSATRTNRRNPRAMTSQHPTIGSLLRSLRARNGWTLKEMSERCGIPLSTLSKVEHDRLRSEEHTSELQSLMRISYDVFGLKKKNINK